MDHKAGTASNGLSLRVSVATYNQVIFPHPENGTTMLALERKATVLKDGNVSVRAQPFGGGVRILDPKPLKALLGEIQFDSERSKQERDFRILIPSSKWDMVKAYCLRHLANPDDAALESTPDRELTEEFEETIHVVLKSGQYKVHPLGFVIEDHPVPTDNMDVCGQLTVRIYRIFEVRITDAQLCKTMLALSQFSNDELKRQALKSKSGRANTVLTLPLDVVRKSYLLLPPQERYKKITVDGFELDESVLAVLGDVGVPQYQKV